MSDYCNKSVKLAHSKLNAPKVEKWSWPACILFIAGVNGVIWTGFIALFAG